MFNIPPPLVFLASPILSNFGTLFTPKSLLHSKDHESILQGISDYVWTPQHVAVSWKSTPTFKEVCENVLFWLILLPGRYISLTYSAMRRNCRKARARSGIPVVRSSFEVGAGACRYVDAWFHPSFSCWHERGVLFPESLPGLMYRRSHSYFGSR